MAESDGTMKLITINILGVSSNGIKVLVDHREQQFTGDEMVAMLRRKLAMAAEGVAVLLPHGKDFEWEPEYPN